MKFLDLFKRQASPYTAKRAPLAAALEPRMLFDGAVAATAAEAASSAEHQTAEPAKAQTADGGTEHASDTATPPAASSDQRQEVVFIDGKVTDKQQLIDGLKPGAEVVVLDSNKDGLQQIADYLQGRSDISAIHVLSHGDVGKISLGNTWLDSAAIEAKSGLLADIGSALTQDGDILLYGCEVAADGSGKDFINRLASATKADVAASTDLTGASTLGGNWSLEARQGNIEANSLSGLASYGRLLTIPDDEGFEDNPSYQEIKATKTFVLDGFRYTLTGPGADADYDHFLGIMGGAPLGPDKMLRFDTYGTGATSVKIELADGSAFRLMSLSFYAEDATSSGGPSESFNLTPGGSSALTYTTDQAYQNVDFSANTTFYNITSVTFSSLPGKMIYLDIDDLNIDTATIPNTAPVATGNSYTVNEDATLTVLAGTSVLANDTDADGDSLTAVLVTGPSHGSLTLNADGSFSYTPNANYSGADSFTYKANDGTADSSPVTVTLTVTAVNDAPQVTNPIPNQNASEGAAFSFQFASNTFSDVDAGATLSYSAQVTGGGALPAWLSFNSATRTFSGTPADSDVGTISIDIIASDGNGGTVTDTFNIAIADTNATPVVTLGGSSPAFTEGNNVTSTPVAVDSGLTLSDADNTTLASASVSITGNFHSGQDVLAFTNNPATMGNISASYNSATGELTLTSAGATATLAQWQAALRSVTYSNGSDAPSTTNRTISFVVNDGQTDSSATTKTVSVAAVNDVPQVTAPATINFTEDMSGAITGISFSDADAGSASVTVTLSVASGSLAASSGGGVTVGGSNSALTLTGSIANINSFISGSSVSFTTAANATSDVALTASINDGGNTGSGGAQADSTTVTLQVAAVNDAPIISAPGSIAINEDAPGALSGISFSDVDAGTGPVTVTLSVPSGSLAATSASGVTVGGTASALTLTGSISDINAFIAASGVRFTTASNASANVTLTIDINDGGNTGTGGALTDSQTVTLTVTAVNDAPVNSIPAAQNVDQDASLVFNSGNGNLISVSDVDAGGGTLQVTLTASNGLIMLSGTSGLIFTVGSGTNDATMTFEGSVADINSALNGLTFSPTAGYNGSASLQITTNDLGGNGSGGAQTDTDTLNITVNSLNPRITDVSSSTANGTYKVGDTIIITTTFNQAVTVDTTGGSPSLLLETGLNDRSATYVSGSGTNTLTFSYTVQAGDLSSDLDYQSTAALALNGASIRNATSDDAVLTLPTVATAGSLGANKAIVIDGVAATVSSVAVPANGTYVAGQHLDFTVSLSESVTVDTSGGTPRIAITLNTGGTVYASYLAGSGTGALVFRLTVASGQLDSNGISIGNSIEANGGSLRDAAGNNSVTSLNAVGSTSGVLIDAAAPEVGAISLDAASPTNASSVTFTVTFSEDVSGVDIGDFSLATTGSVNATLQSLVQIDPRTYQVTVDTITGLGSLGLNLNANGTAIIDSVNNAIAGAFTGQAYTIGIPAVTPTPDVTGDPEFRTSDPVTLPDLPNVPLQPQIFGPPTGDLGSPLTFAPLFEQRSLGSSMPPLGNIFISNGALAPSFIAQVFTSSDSGGNGSGAGFLGFGGGDGGVFGSSTLSGIFAKDNAPDTSSGPIFDSQKQRGGNTGDGLRGVFGAPTLGQQLHDLNEVEERQLRDLALALGQFELTAPNV